MIRRVDHIVILVSDLERASADYRALGFTVTPGGEHTGGATHNVLVCFADGCYLELIAFRRPAPEHTWYRHVAAGEGLIDFALLPSAIEEDLAAARARGLPLEGPFPGGRLRPDGVQLVWQTGRALTPDLPFFCADVTARELRVPGGAACDHPNGAAGVVGVRIAASDPAATAARYRALLGLSAEEPLALGAVALSVAGPDDPLAAARLAARGEGPLAITIAARSAGQCDTALSHGAQITLAAGGGSPS